MPHSETFNTKTWAKQAAYRLRRAKCYFAPLRFSSCPGRKYTTGDREERGMFTRQHRLLQCGAVRHPEFALRHRDQTYPAKGV